MSIDPGADLLGDVHRRRQAAGIEQDRKLAAAEARREIDTLRNARCRATSRCEIDRKSSASARGAAQGRGRRA
jgi:hypothetical protein